LRYRGISLAPLSPSRDLGADNHEIFGDWLGLSESEIESLKEGGVI
jgi:crotonobetainyl-CoA:carnitine CoA-transferase CaiB-like acyl-CoA transferase